MTSAIEAHDLVKTYGAVRALDGLSLDVGEGAVMAMLGPNGAGKTTTVRVLATLLVADSGRASVGGVDVTQHPDAVRRMIGLSGQYAAVDENLTGRENLTIFGQLYHLGGASARARAGELLEQFRLADAADRPVKTYSGGMRRRLDLAGALVARPRVLFLDEPTTGLDPRSRLEMWEVLGGLVRGGATLLLTTQYLEEADRLADDIAVVDRGRVIARGTSDMLKAQVGGERLEVVVHEADHLAAAEQVLRAVGQGQPTVDHHTRRVAVAVTGGAPVLVEALRSLDEREVRVDDIGLHRPTLDDVFLALTGHVAEEDTVVAEEPVPARRARAGRS